MEELLGGDGPAPAAHGVGDGRDQEVEGLGRGADVVEISHGCTHGRTLTGRSGKGFGCLTVRAPPGSARPCRTQYDEACAGGTDTDMVISTGSAPLL
ncbi:hypothetical protein GCM10010449_52760 [Streptomyces rectiviolaceus]|uniref:Uncharacterized protein n=1 Tax=Streptomyces rectiviolaceus TaxID=332591 RepID=A0ABP6MUY6_9ACTN